MSRRLVCGVGINDADYAVHLYETVGYLDGVLKRKMLWVCPFYRTWKGMLVRSYSNKYKAKNPTYEQSTVLPGWYLFSSFKSWMQEQDWEDKQLDKDLLVRGNKVYSPKTCVFVSRQVNTFLIDSGATRGEYLIGVNWDKVRCKFKAQCRNPFTKEKEYLGQFASELEAHKAWLQRKLELSHALAALQTDERIAKALISRYENYELH